MEGSGAIMKCYNIDGLRRVNGLEHTYALALRSFSLCEPPAKYLRQRPRGQMNARAHSRERCRGRCQRSSSAGPFRHITQFVLFIMFMYQRVTYEVT